MSRSECFCEVASCNSANEGNRFMYVKEGGINGCITDRVNFEGIEYRSGLVENDIANCELKCRVHYRDKEGDHNWQGSKHKKHKR